MKKTLIVLLALLSVYSATYATTEDTNKTEETKSETTKKKKKNVTYNEKGEIIKTGINLGPLPVIAFDADRGFQFGALLNIFDFGDGSKYPNPNSQWYIEASAYLKDAKIGSYKFVLNYDNKTLIPGVRMSICSGYFKDTALDFYGFNGYQSNYDMSLLEPTFQFDGSPDKGSEDYNKIFGKFVNKGKMPMGFYRHGRDAVRFRADFTGEIAKNFYWEAGYNFSWTKTQSFKPQGYSVFNNNSQELVEDGLYVPGGTTLFDLYKAWGIIPEDQADGGFTSGLRLGLMYDSRNVENNPTKGIWAEGHLMLNPKWLGSSESSYKYSFTMRQYVPIVPEKFTFAYRLGYEGTIGNAPWYTAPYYTSMGIKPDYDGFGGYRTVRGLMLNRVQGLDVGFYNIEFRYKFVEFKLWKQNIAFTLSAFTDGAYTFRGYDMTNRTGEYIKLYNKLVNKGRDGFHGSAGAGLRFIMNQNFIVAFEGAQCFNKQDGGFAFYLNTGFLF